MSIVFGLCLFLLILAYAASMRLSKNKVHAQRKIVPATLMKTWTFYHEA